MNDPYLNLFHSRSMRDDIDKKVRGTGGMDVTKI